LKPEWWGSPLAQEQKYQGRKKPVTRNDDDDDNNNNNNNNNNTRLQDRILLLKIPMGTQKNFSENCG
jgi:hypothetical protein